MRPPLRREYLTGIAGAIAAGLAGCATDTTEDTQTGLLSTAVTDQPGDIGDFESCVVTIEGIWVGPQTETETDDDEEPANETDDDEEVDELDPDDIDEGEGRTYYAFDEPQEADLVQLQGEATQLIDEDRELSVATYAFLQLDVSEVEGVLTDGTEATVETPGNAPVQFNQEFEIRENTRTMFTADFTPVRRGPPDSTDYVIQPVPRGIEITYEEIESDEESDEPTNETES